MQISADYFSFLKKIGRIRREGNTLLGSVGNRGVILRNRINGSPRLSSLNNWNVCLHIASPPFVPSPPTRPYNSRGRARNHLCSVGLEFEFHQLPPPHFLPLLAFARGQESWAFQELETDSLGAPRVNARYAPGIKCRRRSTLLKWSAIVPGGPWTLSMVKGDLKSRVMRPLYTRTGDSALVFFSLLLPGLVKGKEEKERGRGWWSRDLRCSRVLSTTGDTRN